MSTLLEEIHEQPQVLRRLLQEASDEVRSIAREVQRRRFDSVIIAARGTSDNAATYAKYVFGAWNHLPVALAAPSLFTLYRRPPALRDGLVVAISQSGMSPDILAVVQEGRRQGAPTLAVTNDPTSPLGQTAEWVIDLHAGPEVSVAATKTYTAELAALALLSALMDNDEGRLEELHMVPDAVAAALALHGELSTLVERYRYMDRCIVTSRGYNYATALEIALKLKELTYVAASPYSSADLRHGPIAVVEPDYPVLLIATKGDAMDDLRSLLCDLADRKAELIVVSDSKDILDRSHTALRLPIGLPEWLSPLVAVVPGQLLSYHLCVSKGLDPDRPRGLSKVTRTR